MTNKPKQCSIVCCFIIAELLISVIVAQDSTGGDNKPCNDLMPLPPNPTIVVKCTEAYQETYPGSGIYRWFKADTIYTYLSTECIDGKWLYKWRVFATNARMGRCSSEN